MNILAGEPDLFEKIVFPAVVTPHIGEMSRLTGKKISEIKEDLPGTAVQFAKERKVSCVLKDARTVTADPFGNIWLNLTGSDALAKAGSGDVLAGIAAGCIARFAKCGQGTEEFMGLVGALAAYLHGRCGQEAGQKTSANTVLARDIIRYMAQYI